MERMKWIAVVAVICLSTMALVAGDRVVLVADRLPAGRIALEGTWQVEISILNCQNGAAVRPPFPAMATFSRGGTVITSDSSIPPSLRGAGHGVWSHAGGTSYDATIEAFLFDGTGAWSGRQRFVQRIEMTGADTFEVRIAAEIFNAQGVVIGKGCASSVGSRLQ